MASAGVRRRRPLHFMLVAGEPSGDALGGALMCALRSATDGEVRFTGVGGAEMEAEGLPSLFPMAELSLMGLAEVAPRVPALRRRLRESEQHARSAGPDVLVTIDAPAFNFRLARRLRGSSAPIVHYVAPQVWAWGAGRAARIAPILDHLLALLPFEPPLFEAVGLPCTFVGHPVVESGADCGDGERFRIRHGIAPTAPVLAVLPGSRRSETTRLLRPFAAALSLLADAVPGLRAAVPVVPALAPEVAAAAAQWPVSGHYRAGRGGEVRRPCGVRCGAGGVGHGGAGVGAGRGADGHRVPYASADLASGAARDAHPVCELGQRAVRPWRRA